VAVLFHVRVVVARLVAILGLVGLCAEGVTAQSAPQLRLAALESTALVTERATAPASRKLYGPTVANNGPTFAKTGSLKLILGPEVQGLATCHSDPAMCPTAASPHPAILVTTRNRLGCAGIGSMTFACFDILPNFVATYLSLRRSLAARELPHIRKLAEFTGTTMTGIASTYNPYRGGSDSGGKRTASGEPYDPAAWTAAIRIDLREQFGGVRYGKDYLPTYALVESGEKQVIVKINDLGPLTPDRVIDLNERSMRYFDPSMKLGLIQDVKITPLPGVDWSPGPIGGERLITVAAAQ
jgi:peptidoglycan lytic transglycosylase